MLDTLTLLLGIFAVLFTIGIFLLFLFLIYKLIKQRKNIKITIPIAEKQNIVDSSKIADIGLYFMDMCDNAKKKKNIVYSHELETYYWLVGLATQGRLDEIEEIYTEEKEQILDCDFEGIKELSNEKIDDEWWSFLTEIKPRLLKMGKIAEKVDKIEIRDLKTGESIGEWQSRKLKKYKTFMSEFEYFKNYDIESALKKII